jgi:hypothetical protein
MISAIDKYEFYDFARLSRSLDSTASQGLLIHLDVDHFSSRRSVLGIVRS